MQTNINTLTTNLNSTGNDLQTQINTLSSKVIYTTGNQIKSGRLIIGDDAGSIVDPNSPYTLSLQTNSPSTWLEILNNSGANKGVFFGIEGNNFEQWNYQGGDIKFFTSENVSDGFARLTIKNDGKIGIGTSSPSEKLEVIGNVKASGASFIYRPTVNGIRVLLSGDIPYVQTNSYFYVDATRTDSYVENGNILYPYKTLSGAYNAAKNIASFHNPTYITLLSPIAENLTIDKGYINLIGNNTNKNDPIRITGSLVFAATGIGTTATDNNFSIAGLGVTATSNNKCILFSGNNPQRLFIQDCWLIAKDNGTCLYSNNTNTTSRLQGDILKLSPEGVNTTAIDIVSGISSISFAETSSSASVLAYVRNNSTLNISNSQIETAGAKAFQVENTARLTLLNSALTNTANPSTGIFLKDAFSTAVVVGSVISVPANANSYAINGAAYSYLFYKNLYFSIDAIGGSTESKIGNNVNKNLINSYDPVVYSIGNQTISGVKTFDVFPVVSGNKLITGVDLSSYATTDNLASTGSTLVTNLASTGSTLDTKINTLSGYVTGAHATFASITNLANTGSTLNTKINNLSGISVLTFGDQNISGNKTFINNINVSGSGIFNALDLNNIDALSLSGVDISITSGNIALTNRPTVNGTGVVLSGELDSTGILLSNRINSLSGYINSSSSNIVFTTGNQTISGIKSFAQDTTFGDSAQGDFLVISGNNFTVYGSGNFTSGLFVNGNAVLTGVDLTSYATVANLASTGSTLNTKINNLSGYVTGITGTFGTSVNLLNTYAVLTTGNQTINGLKTFTSGIDIYSGASPQSLRIFNSTGTNSGEFALIGWRNNEFVIGSQRTTSGILRDVTLTGANINLSPSGTVIIKGNINVTGSGIFSNGSVSAISLLNNPLSVVGSGNSYVQLNIQNRASGTIATADLVITANNGTDNSNFINLGINNSGYNDPAFSNGSGLDGYLFVNGGSLDIGTQTSGTHIEFHVEGTTLDKVVGRFTSSGLDLNNSKLINATPQIINLSSNFNISADYNSRMIMVNSATEVTGTIISGNALGFNAGITQIGAGKIFITGSGIGITIGSYNNQYRTAGQFATASVLHTGNNGYVMYGNTAL